MYDWLQQLPNPTKIVELATALRTTPISVRRAINRGELHALRTSHRGDQRLTHEAIVAWLNGDSVNGTASKRRGAGKTRVRARK